MSIRKPTMLSFDDAKKLTNIDELEQSDDPYKLEGTTPTLCHNHECPYKNHQEVLDNLYVYAVDDLTSVNICSQCYDNGYRLCLCTHTVCHLKDLTKLGDDSYVLSSVLNNHQLTNMADFYGILEQLGITNSTPAMSIINLHEIDDF